MVDKQQNSKESTPLILDPDYDLEINLFLPLTNPLYVASFIAKA